MAYISKQNSCFEFKKEKEKLKSYQRSLRQTIIQIEIFCVQVVLILKENQDTANRLPLI